MIPFLKLSVAPDAFRPYGISYRRAAIRTEEHWRNTFAPARELVPAGARGSSDRVASAGRSAFQNPTLAQSLFLPNRMGLNPHLDGAKYPISLPRNPAASHSLFRRFHRWILDCAAGFIFGVWKRLRAIRKADCQRNAGIPIHTPSTFSPRCASASPKPKGFAPLLTVAR